MRTPSIARWIALALALAAVAGCSAIGKKETVQGLVEAGLEAELAVLSRQENLDRIQRISDAIMKAEATRKLARELAAGAVLGVADGAREEALRDAVAGFVEAFSAALGAEGDAGLDPALGALVGGAATSAALGVLDDSVLEPADRFAGSLSRTVASALAAEAAAQLPAILDASLERVSPRLGKTIGRDVAPALAAALTDDLGPALATSLEESLGPALEALLAERLLPAVDRAVSESLPPLVRDSAREAMLGLGDALEGRLGEQTEAFIFSLVDRSKERMTLRAKPWILPAVVIGLLAAVLACVYFWRRAGEQARLRRARESALFHVTTAINRLPADLQERVKSAVAEAGRRGGAERTGGEDLRAFLDRHNL